MVAVGLRRVAERGAGWSAGALRVRVHAVCTVHVDAFRLAGLGFPRFGTTPVTGLGAAVKMVSTAPRTAMRCPAERPTNAG